MDYAYIIYDKPNNISICKKPKIYQCSVALTVTGAVRGSPNEKLFIPYISIWYNQCKDNVW